MRADRRPTQAQYSAQQSVCGPKSLCGNGESWAKAESAGKFSASDPRTRGATQRLSAATGRTPGPISVSARVQNTKRARAINFLTAGAARALFRPFAAKIDFCTHRE